MRFLVLTGLLVAITSLRLWVIPPEKAGNWIVETGYFLLAAQFLIWVALLLWVARTVNWRERLWPHRSGLLVAMALGGSLHLLQPHQFRVMNDEFALLNTSMSMHFHQKAGMLPQAIHIDGELVDPQWVADKRSLGFQFLLSLVHRFTGYRPANAFVLNFAVTLAFFVALYAVLFRASRDRWLAISGLFLIASLPLLTHIATSGGYDLLNAVLILGFILSGQAYLRNPTATHLSLFVYTTLFLAQIRYESVLYLLGLAALVGMTWWRQREIRLSVVAAVSPIFLFLPLMANAHMFAHEQLQDNLVRTGDETFMALSNLASNAADGLHFLFIPSSSELNSAPIAGAITLGLLATIYSWRWHPRKRIMTHGILPVLAAWVPAIICFLVMLANFWGKLTDPQASRFVLPLITASLPLAVLFWACYPPSKKIRMICSLIAAGLFMSLAAQRTLWKMYPVQDAGSAYQEWIVQRSNQGTDPKILYACDGTLGLVANGHSVIPVEVLNLFPGESIDILKESSLAAIEVFELLPPSDSGARLDNAPGTRRLEQDRFDTNILSEIKLPGGLLGRHSRIKAIRPAPESP